MHRRRETMQTIYTLQEVVMAATLHFKPGLVIVIMLAMATCCWAQEEGAGGSQLEEKAQQFRYC